MSSLIKPYVTLCRVSNLPTVWTNVLAAVVLSGAGFAWQDFLLLAASMSLLYSAGMCMNDIVDIERDRTEQPARPIPSGTVPVRDARIIAVILFAGGLIILYPGIHPSSLTAGLFLAGLIILYNLFHQRYFISVFLMGACRLMVFVVCSIATAGTVSNSVMLAGIVQFVYTVSISTVSRISHSRPKKFSASVVPLMISCMSLVDGIILSFLSSLLWIFAGAGGTVLTLWAQSYVKGD